MKSISSSAVPEQIEKKLASQIRSDARLLNNSARFPTWLCAITLALALATCGWMAWNTYASYRDADASRHRDARSEELRGTIVYLDEVLTMSARMAAATGDTAWEERYRHYEPELDAAIKEALVLTPGSSALAPSAQTDAANVKLVAMENQAFTLVRNHRSEEARAVLFAPPYEKQKKLYALGMTQLLSDVRSRIDTNFHQTRRRALVSAAGSGLLLVSSIAIWIAVIASLRRTQSDLKHRIDERTATLQATEERTRLIIATAYDAFIGMDSAGLITDWNPRAEATFGWSSEEAVGQPMHELIIPPKFREMHVRGLKHFLDTGEGPVLNKLIEISALHRDGREMPIELMISPIRIGDNFIFSASLRDITERQRADAERHVISEIVQGVITTTNLNELLELAHRSISKFLYAENCFVALHDPKTDLLHWDFWVDKVDPLPPPLLVGEGFSSYVLRTGQPLLLTEELKTRMYEQGKFTKSGSDSPSWLGVPLRTPWRTIGVLAVQHYEKEGVYNQRDLEFLSSVGDQIALAIERKRAQEELKQSEEDFRTMANNISQLAWMADAKGYIFWYNQRWFDY
nr:PAS domain S-box protein [Blastocatellia bacterium]